MQIMGTTITPEPTASNIRTMQSMVLLDRFNQYSIAIQKLQGAHGHNVDLEVRARVREMVR